MAAPATPRRLLRRQAEATQRATHRCTRTACDMEMDSARWPCRSRVASSAAARGTVWTTVTSEGWGGGMDGLSNGSRSTFDRGSGGTWYLPRGLVRGGGGKQMHVLHVPGKRSKNRPANATELTQQRGVLHPAQAAPTRMSETWQTRERALMQKQPHPAAWHGPPSAG